MDRQHTALIVPALTELAGRCRIVARAGDVHEALRDYRSRPDAWSEVGLMDSRGQLVCCENIGNLVEELKSCEPLMAGLEVPFRAPEMRRRA